MPSLKRTSECAFSDDNTASGNLNLKKHVAKPIRSHVEACTLRLLYQAQIELASGQVRLPIADQGVNCEDCGRNLTDEELDTNHVCSGCCRVVCKYCSLESIYRNNGLECLECLRS